MNKRIYQTPATNVVKLQHTQMLMTSVEGSQATVKDYGWETEDEE